MNPTYSKQAEAYFGKQSAMQEARIRKAIDNLPFGDIKKLRGIKNGYRLRVGKVRILFEQDGNKRYILTIDNRGDVYK